MRKRAFAVMLAVAFCFISAAAVKQSFADERTDTVEKAIDAMQHMMVLPVKGGVPAYVLHRARGIAVFPSAINAGAIAAGRVGEGVLLVRNNDSGWSNPVFISLLGGSLGAQLGVESTTLVLIIYEQKSIDDLLNGRVLTGFNGSIAAGPVGKDWISYLDPQNMLLAYSRSKGVFLGYAFSTNLLWVDKLDNAEFYQAPGIKPNQIIEGKGLMTPSQASDLKMNMARLVDLGQ